MNIPTTLLCIAAVLFVLAQIPLGCSVEYSVQGPKVWVHMGVLKICVFPMKKKETKGKPQKAQKKKKPKKTVQKEPVSTRQKLGGALAYAQQLLPIVLQALGQFKKKLKMEILRLELISGAIDPADAALRYGQASAVLGALWYPLTEALDVRDGYARVVPDFESNDMSVYAYGKLTIKLGQILWIGVYFGLRGLTAFLSVRKQLKNEQEQRKAV